MTHLIKRVVNLNLLLHVRRCNRKSELLHSIRLRFKADKGIQDRTENFDKDLNLDLRRLLASLCIKLEIDQVPQIVYKDELLRRAIKATFLLYLFLTHDT